MNVRRYPFLGLTLLAAVSLMVSTPWDALTAAQSEIDTFMERVLQRVCRESPVKGDKMP